MAVKHTCPTCGGSGRLFNWLGMLMTPANWVPFTVPKDVYVRCDICNGRGVVYRKWNPRPYRLTRRRPR